MAESTQAAPNGGTKAFAGVVVVLAVIAGVYAMVEPMSQRIDVQNDQLGESKIIIESLRTWISEHDRIIERRDAEQWERIKGLEREVFHECARTGG